MSASLAALAIALASTALLASSALAAGESANGIPDGQLDHPMTWGGTEIAFLPGIGRDARSSTLIVSRGGGRDLTRWFSLGTQTSLGYQIGSVAPGTGNWCSSMSGIVPRCSFSVGPVHVAFGALLGLGAMLSTQQVAGVNDVVRLKGLWAAEPRLEFGLAGGPIAGSIFGGYLFTPDPADLGGLMAGIRIESKVSWTNP